jgi:hypothetical protein
MATKYVLPHLRKAAPAPTLETKDLTSQELFPQLGEAKQSTWTGKSFKQTIEDLIAYEKLSEQEKDQQELRAKAMSGWHVLPKVTHDWLLNFNEKMIVLNNGPMKDMDVYQSRNTVVKVYADDEDQELIPLEMDSAIESESEPEVEDSYNIGNKH